MDRDLTHDMMHEQGIAHDHTHQHGHSHTHTHKETKAVLNRMSKIIGHIDHCIVDAVKENDTESIEELKNAIDKFL